MSEAKSQWKEESDRIESKINALLALERERLALECEKLEFKKLLLQEQIKIRGDCFFLHGFNN